jgi:hypothetical protein
MPCCNPTITTFFNESVTTIGYGPSMQAAYGDAPKVTVVYWDGTQYVAAGIFTSVSLVGYPVTSIVIDHGSDSAIGLVKIG